MGRAHQWPAGCERTSSSLYQAVTPTSEPELLSETRWTELRRSGSRAVAVVPFIAPVKRGRERRRMPLLIRRDGHERAGPVGRAREEERPLGLGSRGVLCSAWGCTFVPSRDLSRWITSEWRHRCCKDHLVCFRRRAGNWLAPARSGGGAAPGEVARRLGGPSVSSKASSSPSSAELLQELTGEVLSCSAAPAPVTTLDLALALRLASCVLG